MGNGTTFAPGRLALEDGSVYRGRGFGQIGEVDGEVVFNTSLTGYQEILTDPSYAGQLVTMTYPLIGNYGITLEDMESRGPFLRGFVVKEVCRKPSNFRATHTLDEFMRERGVAGIEGVDTRAITLKLRDQGALRGILSFDVGTADAALVERARASQGVVGMDFVREVACKEPYTWQEGYRSKFSPPHPALAMRRFRVVAIDYGIKTNILRSLVEVGCDVEVVPPVMTANDILSRSPDGVFLSNGPGDPAALDYAVDTVKGLLGKVPVFGICLGHQLMARATGATTFKLPFGHHGGNHPVKDLETGRVEITAQNHGFAVDATTLPSEARMTHLNLNDQTCEGVDYPHLGAYSVQYHPEAAPGPHDSFYLFKRFIERMEGSRS